MTPRDLCLRYFDKAVLGAAAAWLAMAASAFGAAPSDGVRAELDGAMAALTQHMQGATLRPGPAPGWAGRLGEQLREAPPAPSTAPTWSFHKRPAFLHGVVPPAQPPTFVHTAARQVVADASERGRIVVRWSPGDTAYVLATCTVERRRGDGPWEAVASVPAAAREVVDEAVDPRSRYAYRVVTQARADEDDLQVKAALAAGTFEALAPDLVRRESEPSADVETAAEVFVVPLSVDVVPNRPEAGSAYVIVHRWDRGARRFTSARVRVKVGDRVGETGAVLDDVGVDGATLWVALRDPATGEVLREDSRRDRLPDGLR